MKNKKLKLTLIGIGFCILIAVPFIIMMFRSQIAWIENPKEITFNPANWTGIFLVLTGTVTGLIGAFSAVNAVDKNTRIKTNSKTGETELSSTIGFENKEEDKKDVEV